MKRFLVFGLVLSFWATHAVAYCPSLQADTVPASIHLQHTPTTTNIMRLSDAMITSPLRAVTFYPLRVRQTIQHTPYNLIYCVGGDYLAVGTQEDFLRLSPSMPGAAVLANRHNLLIPTPMMVQQIHQVASLQLPPIPQDPSVRMTHLSEALRHHTTLQAQIRGQQGLISGHKKDIVFTRRHFLQPGRLALYGWFDGATPIQPLSLFHGAFYGDYSHGLRPVARQAWLNGDPIDLAALLNHPTLHVLVSDEGPIDYTRWQP